MAAVEVVDEVGSQDFAVRDAGLEDGSGRYEATDLVAQPDVLLRGLCEGDAVLSRLSPDRLDERLQIQARDITVLDAVYQVVQHFALHLGQIILIAKAEVPGAVKFYEDAGGKARPIWKE